MAKNALRVAVLLFTLSLSCCGTSSEEDDTAASNIQHNDTCRTTLNLDGGTYSIDSFNTKANEDFILPTDVPEKERSEFYAWYEAKTKHAYFPGDTYKTDTDNELTALYQDIAYCCHFHHETEERYCEECGGTGTIATYADGTCPSCHGSGQSETRSVCSNCYGGKLWNYRCGYCYHTIYTSSRYEYYTMCPNCASAGRGVHAMSTYGSHKCPYCTDGWVKGPMGECSRCGGDGICSVKQSETTCEACSGIGILAHDITCPNCIGQKCFSMVDSPHIVNASNGHVEVQPVQGYEYAVIYFESLVDYFETNNNKVNLFNINYQSSPIFDNLHQLEGTHSCYLVVMRGTKDNHPDIPSKYTIIDNTLKIYRFDDEYYNYHFAPVDPRLGKYNEAKYESASGLNGKEVILISGKDYAHFDYDVHVGEYKYYQTSHYALKDTTTSDYDWFIESEPVQLYENDVYSDYDIPTVRFIFYDTTNGYKIYLPSINKYLSAYVSIDDYYYIGYDIPTDTKYSSIYWKIKEYKGYFFLYAIMGNGKNLYLSFDSDYHDFKGTQYHFEANPIYLAERA